ncbi:MAG: GNAT family N-acetyltransferase [Acidimicrobiia bacterium]|nr:GNAT family N-acetyltransferase [Acidimicrobiia bacterium]
MSIGARRAGAGDLARICELFDGAVAELSLQRGGPLWAVRESRARPVEAELARAIEAEDHVVVVGTIDDYVAGFAVLRIETLRDGSFLAVLDEIFTDAALREVGVGEAMMGLAIDAARLRGCRGIDSFALPGDRETKNFFESFGLKARALLVHRSLADEDGST